MTPYTFMNRPAAQALYYALTRDPFYITLEKKSSPDPDEARKAMFRYMDYALKEGRDHGRLTLTEDESSGAAIWSVPLPGETEDRLSGLKKSFIMKQMGQGSLDAYTRIVDFMSEQSLGVVPEEAWYLSILGILPESQGKGLGKSLMKPMLMKADEQNRAVYAESFTPENFKFYTKLGFIKTQTIDEPFTGSPYTILIRPPHRSGSSREK